MSKRDEHAVALLPAHELVDMLRERRLGAEELLDVFLARQEHINPAINAIVATDVEGARASAREADRRLAEGEVAPLLGLPMTIKDTFEVTGMPATCGIPTLAGHFPPRDADAVSRLRAAGAVIFGKTNIPAAGADHQSWNPVYGLTRNPWSLDRTAGGSSGGAAAALAAGLTPLELGSDIGGSIRIPAHCCGVFGHKATYGSIPTRGHIPPMPGETVVPQLSVAGPMARSARDLELAMEVLATTAFPASRSETVRELRVAVWSCDFPYATGSRVRETMSRVANDLAQCGATVSDTARPGFDPHRSHDVYLRTLFSIVMGGQPFRLEPDEKAILPEDAQAYYAILEECSLPDGLRWARLSEQRAALRAEWDRFFKQWDVLICPVFPTEAFAHDLSGEGMTAQLHRRREVDGESHVYMSQLSWPGLATVANLPATAVPVPQPDGELPIGVQIIGPAFEDRTPLRLADLMERELGYRAASPRIAKLEPAA